MATYTSASAIKAAIRQKANQAMQKISNKGLETAQKNNAGFYTGSPKVYERTGQLGSSSSTSGVSGGGSSISTEVYLDDSYSYTTGTWSANQVLNAAEYGTANLVGSPGFWAKTVEEMPDIIEDAFTSVGFSK